MTDVGNDNQVQRRSCSLAVTFRAVVHQDAQLATRHKGLLATDHIWMVQGLQHLQHDRSCMLVHYSARTAYNELARSGDTFASCSAPSRSERCILEMSISLSTYFCPSALPVTRYAAPKLPLPSICPLMYLSAMLLTM